MDFLPLRRRRILKRLTLALVLLLALPCAGAHARNVIHEVIPGETLSRIAKHYHTTPARIRKLNKLTSDHLREGQKLKIQSTTSAPGRVRARYRVRRGESLAQVARRHKISVALLRRLNPKVGTGLRAGQLLWVIKESSTGTARSLYQLEPGPGFNILDRRHAYGTMLLVSRVAEVLSEHGIRNLEKPPVLVGDISRERGGFLAPHHSHRRGRDVDIRYPLKQATTHYVPATASTLDVKRTWSLIRAFIQSGDVIYVFVDYRLQKILYEHAQSKGMSEEELKEIFQYPRRSRSMSGVIRHEPGHRTHFHLRFKPESDGEGPTS